MPDRRAANEEAQPQPCEHGALSSPSSNRSAEACGHFERYCFTSRHIDGLLSLCSRQQNLVKVENCLKGLTDSESQATNKVVLEKGRILAASSGKLNVMVLVSRPGSRMSQ